MIRRRELLVGVGLLLAEPALAHVRGIGRLRAGAAASGPAPATPLTWNSADAGPDIVLANGNRDFTNNNGGFEAVRSTTSKTSGKWYVEFVLVSTTVTAPQIFFGFGKADFDLSNYLGGTATSASVYPAGGSFATGITNAVNLNIAPLANGDVVIIALDFDAGKAWIGKNNAWSGGGDPVAGTTPWMTWTPGGTWFVGTGSNGGTAWGVVRLAATTSFSAPTGFSTWNA